MGRTARAWMERKERERDREWEGARAGSGVSVWQDLLLISESFIHRLVINSPLNTSFSSPLRPLVASSLPAGFYNFGESTKLSSCSETRSNAARAGVSEAIFPSTNRANNRIRENFDDNVISNKAKSLKSNILFIIGLNIEANELKIAIYIFVTTS